MTVKTILSTKGRDVTTIETTATIETAIGILSERDIVRTLAARGAGALI